MRHILVVTLIWMLPLASSQAQGFLQGNQSRTPLLCEGDFSSIIEVDDVSLMIDPVYERVSFLVPDRDPIFLTVYSFYHPSEPLKYEITAGLSGESYKLKVKSSSYFDQREQKGAEIFEEYTAADAVANVRIFESGEESPAVVVYCLSFQR